MIVIAQSNQIISFWQSFLLTICFYECHINHNATIPSTDQTHQTCYHPNSPTLWTTKKDKFKDRKLNGDYEDIHIRDTSEFDDFAYASKYGLICIDDLDLFGCVKKVINYNIQSAELIFEYLSNNIQWPNLLEEIHNALEYDKWIGFISEIKNLIEKETEFNYYGFKLFGNNERNKCNSEIMDVINNFKLHGQWGITELMKLWNEDDALKQYQYTLDDMLKQQLLIKERLFVIVSSGQFNEIHKKLKKYTQKFMKYNWRNYNTVLYMILKVKRVYDECHQFAHWSLYFNCMMAPEAKTESTFSILKLLLSKHSEISINDINCKFRILSYFRHEFSERCLEFIKRISGDYLKCNRAPFTKYSKKEFGTVLDCILKEETLNVDVMIDDINDDNLPEFSESEDDVIQEVHDEILELLRKDSHSKDNTSSEEQKQIVESENINVNGIDVNDDIVNEICVIVESLFNVGKKPYIFVDDLHDLVKIYGIDLNKMELQNAIRILDEKRKLFYVDEYEKIEPV